MASSDDFIRLQNAGYTGALSDMKKKWLRDQGYDNLNQWLAAQGYTGATSDMLKQAMDANGTTSSLNEFLKNIGIYGTSLQSFAEANFAPVIYTGDGLTGRSVTGVGFQPDLVWIRNRDAVTAHILSNVNSGPTKFLQSQTTSVEGTNTEMLQSFDSNGFTVGSNGNVNASGQNHVAWCWKAGGTPVSNTDGTITSSVSANQDAGFSVATYSGAASAGSIGHGLSETPEFVIIKNRSAVTDWLVAHTVVDGTQDALFLNTTASNASGAAITFGASTVSFSSTSTLYNFTGNDFVAYCFHSVPGYSKIGTYVGTGVTGLAVTTGFTPRYVMIKRAIGGTGNWLIFDTIRGEDNWLGANLTQQEFTTNYIDMAADGFTVSATGADANASGNTYLYMAFA